MQQQAEVFLVTNRTGIIAAVDPASRVECNNLAANEEAQVQKDIPTDIESPHNVAPHNKIGELPVRIRYNIDREGSH